MKLKITTNNEKDISNVILFFVQSLQRCWFQHVS